MRTFDYAGPDAQVRDSCDWVVVGTGAGGGALARVLAESGANLVLLEEGPPVDRALAGRSMWDTARLLFRDGMTASTMGRSFIPVLQGRCVGGGTAINSAICWRLPDKGWKRAFVDHGLAEAIDRRALEDAFDFLERELNIHPTEAAVAGRSNELFAQGAARLGLEAKPTSRNERGCTGSGLCMQACPTGRKLSADATFVPWAEARGARVYATCRAERVLVKGGRAVGVVARFHNPETGESGAQVRIDARRGVLVAAGAVQSPLLLARSGVRLRALGRHFRAHPASGLAGLYDEPVRPWAGATQGHEMTALRERGIKCETIMMGPELMGVRFPGAGAPFMRMLGELPHMAMWGAAVLADAEGRVSEGLLGPVVRYTPAPGDMAMLREALKTVAAMHFAAGARQVVPSVHGMPERIVESQLPLFDEAPLDPRGYSMIASHLFGTCRMGLEARDSVVGPDFRVHGTQNLHVADASVFPSNVGVNPQLTIMALAVLCARRLAA